MFASSRRITTISTAWSRRQQGTLRSINGAWYPQNAGDAKRYIDTALAWRDAGTAVPFAIVLLKNGAVIGSTRFWDLERWSWPEGHPEKGKRVFDVGEIGHTWLAASAIRTAVNTEAKLLC